MARLAGPITCNRPQSAIAVVRGTDAPGGRSSRIDGTEVKQPQTYRALHLSWIKSHEFEVTS
jgi:hypothetical protein